MFLQEQHIDLHFKVHHNSYKACYNHSSTDYTSNYLSFVFIVHLNNIWHYIIIDHETHEIQFVVDSPVESVISLLIVKGALVRVVEIMASLKMTSLLSER